MSGGVGEDDIVLLGSALAVSSSSSDADEEEGRTLRFRLFAGGAMPAGNWSQPSYMSELDINL